MDPNQPQPNQSLIPQDITQAQTPPPPKSQPNIPLIILATLTLIASIIAAYFYGKSQGTTQTTKPVGSIQEETTPTQTPQPTTITPTPATLTTYTDPQINTITFQYNPTQWQLTPISENNYPSQKQNRQLTGPGIYLTSLTDDGELVITYALPAGRGGSTITFKQSQYTKLTDTLSRIQIDNEYTYGLDDTLILFSRSPQKRTEAINLCQEYADPNYEFPRFFTDSDCTGINEGTIIGYVQDPLFMWSLTQETNTPLFDQDTITSSENLPSNTQLITIIRYYGPNPQAADAIVTQLY